MVRGVFGARGRIVAAPLSPGARLDAVQVADEEVCFDTSCLVTRYFSAVFLYVGALSFAQVL